MSKPRICDDTCEHCLYICEGDFFCEVYQEIVTSDWIPNFGGVCLQKPKKKSKRGKKK